ncbi:MAG: hypothetical protein ACOVMQ_11030 [Cyclobacteriaceae bacterium]|jgi:predicted metal-dependent HD superfamily phosphohydrolase
MLQSVFSQLVSAYTNNTERADQLWEEITRAYQSKGRYYHTLAHLEHLYEQLLAMRPAIHDWHMVLFTLFYHDFVYNPVRSDNEAKSAEVAVDRMKLIGVHDAQIALCRLQIEATKAHALSPDADTNYFTDADLSVLGQDAEMYRTYCEQVRKEYSIFPDFIYKPGRRKVLNHFLSMPRIFKTDFAYQRWEQPARINLAEELHTL